MVGVLVHVCVSSKGSKSSKPVLTNRPCVKLKKSFDQYSVPATRCQTVHTSAPGIYLPSLCPPHSASVVIPPVQLPITQ